MNSTRQSAARAARRSFLTVRGPPRRQISRSSLLQAEPQKEQLKHELRKLGQELEQASPSVGKVDFKITESSTLDGHHGEAGKHDDHGHHDEHHDHDHHDHHHSEPVKEPLGTAFYVFAAALPVSMIVYVLSHPANDGKIPIITSLLGKYGDLQAAWNFRNDLHQKMMEQAAVDRHLFHSATSEGALPLRFNEAINSGSPHNLSAGQQGRNMQELVDFYERKNAEVQDRIRARLEAERRR